MPLIEEPQPVRPSPARAVPVGASVPVEVFWVAHGLRTAHIYRNHPLLPEPPHTLVTRLHDAWGDGGPISFGEALVIADQLGVLFTESIEDFQAALRQGARVDPRLPLRSETADDRQSVLERLGRLGRDRGLRQRYAALAGEVWSHVTPAWEDAGRREVAAAVDRLRRQSARGGDLIELIGTDHHIHEPWFAQVEEAYLGGRLSIAVSYFGGMFLAWDLPNTYLIGAQAAPEDERTRLRRHSQRLAGRLKVLSDPTRLAILFSLSRQPASVTELARSFGLAQPTVSAHLKLLREAELVEGGRESGRQDYTADPRAVSLLLKEVEHHFQVKPSGPSRSAR